MRLLWRADVERRLAKLGDGFWLQRLKQDDGVSVWIVWHYMRSVAKMETLREIDRGVRDWEEGRDLSFRDSQAVLRKAGIDRRMTYANVDDYERKHGVVLIKTAPR